MSAFMCDADHIGFLAAYLAQERHAGEVGAEGYAHILAAENFRSIRCRYPDVTGPENWPGPLGFASLDEYTTRCATEAMTAYGDFAPLSPAGSPQGQVLAWRGRRLKAVDILKSVGCYDYQACECGDYAASEGAKLVDAIRHRAIQRLPGYERATCGAPGGGV